MRGSWTKGLTQLKHRHHESRRADQLTDTELSTVDGASDIHKRPEQVMEEADDEKPVAHGQHGVQAVEAVTLTWTKTSLAVVYITMWSLYLVNAFQSSITSSLTPYVISGFELHSLIPVISVVSNVMCGAAYLPIAKTLDLWGRSQGIVLMTTIATVGLILMATCSDIATYCAAQVFYSVGFVGIIYSVDVITSDTSALRNRGLAYAFTSSPYMISAFAGPTAAESFYETINWRWGFGLFAILLPFVAAPLVITLQLNERRAKRSGVLRREPSGRVWWQSIWHYLLEFDALGVIVLAAGLVLFLLPFSLAGSTAQAWKSPSIIAMLVVGFVLLLAFGPIERYIARKPFIPFHLLVSRTLLGTCFLSFTYQIAYYCWASYFSSYLQVVNDLTIAQAGYVSNTFDVISGAWLLICGYLIRRTGRFKWLLICAVPLHVLFMGLMIYFRQPHTNIGKIVMCQIFIAFAGSTIILCEQVSVLSVAEHGDVAAVLALLGLFGYMGGAVGNSISGAIWTNTLPQALERLLPDAVKPQAADIYGDLTQQLSFAMGTPAREAIIEGYAIAQTRMLAAGTGIMAFALLWVLMIRNINVKEVEQVKGTLF
ncbi:hypothetical protein LTR97_011046 [Elasticomyces elasticus]|uniref:Major facilitator superfamily (MFS) profile domain-containing protein n=1 Tax=Elasticomyces elasticus TaxID=574655 RepID=A0AAN8A006_9PEZI|nr:hypothetical protein LTR97_011046 [Elasticomyces elasticus]